MNKSKFLKKSLAMLLALMLVVAMIPLSASAASSGLQAAYAAATDDVKGQLTQDGNTLTGSYRQGASTVDLTLVVGTGSQVYYTDQTTAATTEKKVTVMTNNQATITGLKVADYATDVEGNVEITVSVDGVSYTVALAPVLASVETEITDFELNQGTGANLPNWETASIGVDFVSVTMPYDSGDEYTIRNMSVSKGATWTITSDGQTYTGDDEGIVNSTPGVDVKDEAKITIENGGRSQTYTLHINIADGFTSFETAEGLDKNMFTDSGDIVVLLPFGTAADAGADEDVTVTPIFTLDYPGATAYWNDGDNRKELNGVDDTITINSDIIVDGTLVDSSEKGRGWGATYHCYQGDDASDWAARKTAGGGFDAFAADIGSGTTGTNGVAYAEQNGYSAKITIVYADESERTYNVYFCETQENNEAAITGLTIGSEQAVIDEENKTIDITLPNGTDLSDLVLDDAKTTLNVTASYGADIEFVVPDADANVVLTAANKARSATNTYTSDATIDARNPITVVVTSEDNSNHTDTEVFYTLNINASSEYVDAEIENFIIKNDDGYEFTAEPDKNGNVILKVPYEIYERDQLDDGSWKLFYTKTVGTLATCNGTALPVTGSTITAAATYLPASIADGTKGDAIKVRMAGEDLTANTKTYYIEIQRQDPKTVSTLDSFTLVGKEEWEVPGASYKYKAEIKDDNAKDDVINIHANVSWTAMEYWKLNNTFGAIAKAAEDSNARVFYRNGKEGNLLELTNYNTTGYFTPVNEEDPNPETGESNWNLYDGAKIYVLSEQMWVTLEQKGKFNKSSGSATTTAGDYWINETDLLDLIKAETHGDNLGNYTVYELDIDNNAPEEGAGLIDMTLVDGTGWEADLKVNVTGGVLQNLEVPYALTSDLDKNGELIDNGNDTSENPIFLTYDFDEANRAYVMGYDTNAPSRPNKLTTPGKIPTAGVTNTDPAVAKGNAVFYDMAAYTGEWTEDKFDEYVADGLPFLLISRKGDVYVYNYVNGQVVKNDNVDPDKLFVCSEDGTQKQTFEFQLEVAKPNAGTTLSEFWFTGYKNATTTITADTITVTLPYGTDLNKTEYTYLIPNFDFTADSEGAIVTVDDPALRGKPLRSGVTNVNFTTTRKITVIAENENATRQYTVNVVVADAFSDVEPGDWFYDDVMAAAGFGYVNGMGNGKYEPYGATTRAQFAKILAEALDYDPTAYTTSAFPDVANDHWAMAAIAFCADREIILGYETGNFEPSKTITRQEAALMLQRAFDLVGTESTQYPDDAKIAGWAEDGVYAVKHAGLMKGDADTGNFRPTSTLNRAEMATILMNAHRAGLIK